MRVDVSLLLDIPYDGYPSCGWWPCFHVMMFNRAKSLLSRGVLQGQQAKISVIIRFPCFVYQSGWQGKEG